MADIRIGTRETMDRDGLLGMLLCVFSDEDTNGGNGIEYNHFSEDICDDDYLFEKYSDPNLTDEELIVTNWAEWYMKTMTNYCQRWQDYTVEYNDDNEIIAISYAYY